METASFAHAYVTATVLAEKGWRDLPCLIVAGGQEAAEDLARELRLYLPHREVHFLPARGVWYGSEGVVPPRVVGRRAQALGSLRDDAVVVVEGSTLMEKVLPGAGSSFVLQVGERVRFEGLPEMLVDLGYERADQVEEAGEFSVRGGLIDIFPTTHVAPVRVEFWGDEVESIRSFSVYSQRSLASLEHVEVLAAREDEEADARSIQDLLPPGTRVVVVDPSAVSTQVDAFCGDLDDVVGGDGEATSRARPAPEAAGRTRRPGTMLGGRRVGCRGRGSRGSGRAARPARLRPRPLRRLERGVRLDRGTQPRYRGPCRGRRRSGRRFRRGRTDNPRHQRRPAHNQPPRGRA